MTFISLYIYTNNQPTCVDADERASVQVVTATDPPAPVLGLKDLEANSDSSLDQPVLAAGPVAAAPRTALKQAGGRGEGGRVREGEEEDGEAVRPVLTLIGPVPAAAGSCSPDPWSSWRRRRSAAHRRSRRCSHSRRRTERRRGSESSHAASGPSCTGSPRAGSDPPLPPAPREQAPPPGSGRPAAEPAEGSGPAAPGG